MSAAFSAIMMVGAFVLPAMIRGITEASTTRKSFDAMDSELRIDDGQRVVAHLAGSYRVVKRLSFGANELGDF